MRPRGVLLVAQDRHRHWPLLQGALFQVKRGHVNIAAAEFTVIIECPVSSKTLRVDPADVVLDQPRGVHGFRVANLDQPEVNRARAVAGKHDPLPVQRPAQKPVIGWVRDERTSSCINRQSKERDAL